MDGSTRHIGIFGTFDVANYGDLLFPLIAEFELRQRLGAVKIIPFSYHAKSPPEWPFQVTALSDLASMLDQLDGVIIGGGHIVRFDKNIAGRYGPPTPGLHHPTAYWLTPALAAQQAGLPTAWNAPGAHGDFPGWADPLLKLALRDCPYVAVRDEFSRAALAPFARDIAVVPDSAFGVGRLLESIQGDKDRAFALGDLGERYVFIQAMEGLDAVLRLFRDHPHVSADHKLVVVPIGPIHGDRVEHMIDGLPGTEQLPAWPHPLALAALIGQAQAVVGSSLHLAITALACGVPVFRPAHVSSGKHEVLSAFDKVFGFDAAAELDPEWFLSRRGRGQPSPQARAAAERLAKHWDRIADVMTAGRRAVPAPAFVRFWQALPNQLEALAMPTSAATVPAEPLNKSNEASSRADDRLAVIQGGTHMLNMERIRDSVLARAPYAWAMIDSLFTPRDAAALANSYPRDHYKTIEGYDGEKGYYYEARSLIGMGAAAASHADALSKPWRRLAQDLLSPDYRAAMARLTGIDLSKAPIEVNVFHYGPGAWLGPHLDLKDKIVTHVLYFNRAWNRGDGGCLNILRSKDMNDVLAEIPPTVGNSSVLVRSDKSWHAVSRVAQEARHSRRSVTVTFYHPGSVSTMWPPGDATPLHTYDAQDDDPGLFRRLASWLGFGRTGPSRLAPAKNIRAVERLRSSLAV